MNEEQLLREQYEENGSFESPNNSDAGGFGCGGFGYLILGLVAVFALFGVWRYFDLTGSFAGETAELTIYNEANVPLNQTAIENAAQILRQNFGVSITIYIFQNSSDSANRDNFSYSVFLSQRDNSSVPASDLFLVIGVDDQYSEITWGENLNRLDGDNLRSTVLNPRLREGDYTSALVDTFTASTERLRQPNLAVGETIQGYFKHLDVVLAILVLVALIAFSIYRWSQGDTGGYYQRPYYNRGYHSGGSGSRSSSSSQRSSGGGGSSRGSWKS